MTLLPINQSQLATIAPRTVTPDQWKAYWGGNKIERLQRIMESVLVAYGGAWAAWFLSFMMGSFVSAVLGSALIFNWMLTPYLTSVRSNDNLWYKNGQLMHHALFKGQIVSLRKIRRRSGKTIGAITQLYLDILVVDELDRELEIVTPWKDEYGELRQGMSLETMIASTRKDYSNVVTASDAYIPACDLWVGDYPYVDRKQFLRIGHSMLDNFDVNHDMDDDTVKEEVPFNILFPSEEDEGDDEGIVWPSPSPSRVRRK
eukprot:gene6941-7681_t